MSEWLTIGFSAKPQFVKMPNVGLYFLAKQLTQQQRTLKNASQLLLPLPSLLRHTRAIFVATAATGTGSSNGEKLVSE